MSLKSKYDPRAVFLKYFPEQSVDYALELWRKYDFHFKISRKRQTKLGDYRYHFIEKSHTITINHDLNQFQFLITYLHEVAHLVTNVNHGIKIQPHGKEWKKHFKLISQPMMNLDIFPKDVLISFAAYLENPAAATCSDDFLLKTIQKYDQKEPIYLENIPFGVKFKLNKREFVKLELKRTKFICQSTDNGKKYLVPKSAAILLSE